MAKTSSYSRELKVARLAAAKAAQLIMRSYGKNFKIRHKGAINLVTEVDEAAQELIVSILRRHFPSDSILAEEGDLNTTRRASRRWIVDPIDGTTNFAHNYPVFCISIGLEVRGKIVVGVIHDPTRKEVFHAVRGKGAFLNGRKIRVSPCTRLKSALLVTGFPYDLDHPAKNNIPIFLHLMRHALAVRRDGSAALNLAYVAAGRFDGFWELGLCPWDIAAGLLLIEEAGGRIRTFQSSKYSAETPDIIASGPKVFGEFQKQVLDAWV